MKMKKYNAPSIAEAMKMIREDLGDDAVILNSKVVVTKKLFGLIKHKSFEVLAGIDRVEAKIPTQQKLSFKIPVFEEQSLDITHDSKQDSVLGSHFTSSQKDIDDHEVKQMGMSEDLKKEIDELKSIMQSMHRQTIQSQYPDELLPVLDFLKRQELSEELITSISDELFLHYNQQTTMSVEEIHDFIRLQLEQILENVPISGLTYKRKFINLLGPTGVGKTTTIAKMAARAVLERKKKIGFITTDTYRIGAIEQLKTYAALLQAPVEVVYNSTDYEQAIEKLSHLDLVFIDTAGRNYKEAKYVNDLEKLINFDNEVETYLVLSMTAKEHDMDTIIGQFAKLPIEKFIFTKIDETNSIGAMINLMIKYNKGLAYYTNGQEVPEDIEEASVEGLLNLFFQGEEL